jgi:UDP:flavonoid glycosyltransferase YjiC (YdhE family)
MLFAFAGGRGHLEPLVPLARAAMSAGHTVAFAGRPWMASQVEALGFASFAAGSDAGLVPAARPLVAADVEAEMRAVGPGFGRRIARARAKDLLPLCETWRPDLVVCEELDYGAMIAAERLAIPHATVVVCGAGGFVRPAYVAPCVDEVRAAHGLPPDPELAAPGRHRVLTPFPASYRDPAFPLPDDAQAFRTFASTADAERDTRSDATSGRTRCVYFTLGTVFHVESGDLMERVLEGLRDVPAQIVVCVGRERDPSAFGPQPAHVRIERFVPQAQLLPHCDAVISHGGSGSVLGALTHGLPLVLLPIGADQPLNAARCEAIGVGRVLDPLTLTPEHLRETVIRVLEDPVHRNAARQVKSEIAAMPDPDRAVTSLERVASAAR